MRCPYCESEIENDSIFCEKCGKRIEALKPQNENKGSYCVYCGTYNKASASFCVGCGRKRYEEPKPELEPKVEPIPVMEEQKEKFGWKRLEEVFIPPLEPVQPEPMRQAEPSIQMEPMSQMDPIMQMEATTLIGETNDFDPFEFEGATVLLAPEEMPMGYIRRMKTNEEVCLDKEQFIIGKSMSADYVIQDNNTISRMHAAITQGKDGYYLKDLGSTNKTWLGNVQITEPIRLTDGMVFKLSAEEFEFFVK